MLVVPKYKLNRWDKDSIRPGPVGSVGDVNVQVKLKKSSIDLRERYDPTFSGKNAPWSGSNVADGMWYGWTSGGRSATVVSKALPNVQTGGKTNVGWVMQNITASDRSRDTKATPLGRYGWDTTVGSVLKAKTTGEMFLPLPEGYQKSGLPRGSQFPRVIAESIGSGIALPAADVHLTDPVFGDIGTIDVPLPGSNTCDRIKMDYTFTPALDDPLRNNPPPKGYRYRHAFVKDGQYYYDDSKWPDIGDDTIVYDRFDNQHETLRTDPCGGQLREFAKDQPYSRRPLPGNQDKRRQEKKKEMEDEKKKKQKLR
jgi:hypothetical protein